MKPMFARWLSVMLALCLLLSLAPAALMEEMPKAQAAVVEEAAPAVDGEEQAGPAEEATEPAEEVAEPVTDNAAEPASDDDAEPDADAPVPNEDVEEVDVEIASEPVDAVVEESEDAELVDLPVLEAQSDDSEFDLDDLEEQASEIDYSSAMLMEAAGDVNIKNAFPDRVFREFVRQYDTNNDGILSAEERAQVSVISIPKSEVKDLTGIKLFPNLEQLIFHISQVTTLDVSGCSSLKKLLCLWNQQLTTLDVSGCSSLEELTCSENQITTLNVSGCSSLRLLLCGGNQLTTLDVSDCSSLEQLNCVTNHLTTLDVSTCSSLKFLYCEGNQLTTLNVSGCQSLSTFSCDRNQLTTLDVSGCQSLGHFSCSENQLTTLDVTNNLELVILGCESNRLIRLYTGWKPNLWELCIEDNDLEELDISDCPRLVDALKTVRHDEEDPRYISYGDFDGNAAGSLFIVDKTVRIITESKPIVTIDSEHFPDNAFREYVSEKVDKDKNGVITRNETYTYDVIFDIENMNISSLKGIEYLTALQYLYCGGNMLTSIDISKNTELREIHCNNNNITTIDITHCPYLAQHVIPENFVLSDDKRTVTYRTVSVWEGYEWDEWLVCDASVQIIGGNPVVTWEVSNPDPAPAPANDSAPASDPAPASVAPAAPAEPVTIAKAPASTKAKAGKKGKVTVSWKKIKKSKKTKALLGQIKSVQVQYSTDPNFAADVVTKTVSKKKTKLNLKLQKKTTYYIRVRYVGADGVSDWGAVKKVTTKK